MCKLNIFSVFFLLGIGGSLFGFPDTTKLIVTPINKSTKKYKISSTFPLGDSILIKITYPEYGTRLKLLNTEKKVKHSKIQCTLTNFTYLK